MIGPVGELPLLVVPSARASGIRHVGGAGTAPAGPAARSDAVAEPPTTAPDQ